jgi:hypothetical protein
MRFPVKTEPHDPFTSGTLRRTGSHQIRAGVWQLLYARSVKPDTDNLLLFAEAEHLADPVCAMLDAGPYRNGRFHAAPPFTTLDEVTANFIPLF